jgi:dolichol kinase
MSDVVGKEKELLLDSPPQNRAEWEGTGGGSIEYYDGKWWRSFDLVFLVSMILALVALVLVSVFFHPEIFKDPASYWPFWVSEVSKVFLESLIGFLGGLVVVYKNVKVNYTRKIQHLFAYLLPLLFHSFLPKPSSDSGLYKPVISACWGYWFVLLAFLVVIYPIRTRIRFVSIMFSCLDRPEDRPHTLKWIVTQVVLGYVIIQSFGVFCQYMQFYNAEALNYIFVLTTGVGDGLAEPVGIRFGRHKYKTRALCSSRKFTRSLEGSACVFVVCLICCLGFYNSYENWLQCLVACLTIPLVMTLAEAFSPHTWDTPFLMLSGAGLILGITFIPLPETEQLQLIYGLSIGIGGGVVLISLLLLIIWCVRRHPIAPKVQLSLQDNEGDHPRPEKMINA